MHGGKETASGRLRNHAGVNFWGIGKRRQRHQAEYVLCVQRLGKGREKQEKDIEAEASGAGLFSMMEIKVSKRESGRR